MYNKARIGTLSLIAAFISMLFVYSCNSSSSTIYNYYTYGSTAVTAFSLGNDDSVLYNLDSVYFSIDLETATIYNAQPLPYGTSTEKLVVNISTDNCSTVELIYQTLEGNDTTLNYLETSTDSINFSDGPVVLHVISYDEQASRNYLIYVNVYDSEADSIRWDMQSSSLPGGVPSGIKETKFTDSGDIYYMLASDGSSYWISSTEDLYNFSSWSEAKTVNFEMSPNIASFTGCDGKLYILDTSDKLYCSEDQGTSWEDCGTTMSYIYGAYEGTIKGARVEGTSVYAVTYPGSEDPILQPEDFPISGTSALITYYTAWEVYPLAIMVGGITVDGSKSGDVWGYDGNTWAKISDNSLPKSSGRTLFPYTVVETDTTTWRISSRPVLFSFGGLNSDNEMDSTVYYSKDLGAHWVEAPDQMQLADDFNFIANNQVFVQSHIMGTTSRAITPINEWLCPYIYLMGGENINGVMNEEIWRGFLYRYIFTPLE